MTFAILTNTFIYIVHSVKSDQNTGRYVSRLYIPNANRHDTGNYTCALGDFVKATVAVHVLTGKLDLLLLSCSVSIVVVVVDAFVVSCHAIS